MKLINININKYFHMIPLWKSPIKLPVELPVANPLQMLNPLTRWQGDANEVSLGCWQPGLEDAGLTICRFFNGWLQGSSTGSLIGDFHKGII